MGYVMGVVIWAWSCTLVSSYAQQQCVKQPSIREGHNYLLLPTLVFIYISLYAKGTFMCPRNAFALRDRHIYVPADVIQSYEVNSEAKRAFGVSPCLLSSNKCRPHLSTYITPRGRQEGAVLVRDRS